MHTEKDVNQIIPQNSTKKYLALSQHYDGKFQSIKLFKLKTLNKVGNKKQLQHKSFRDDESKLVRCKTDADQHISLKAKKSNLLKDNNLNESSSLIPISTDQKQQLNKIYYYIKSFRQQNLQDLKTSLQKETPVKTVKNSMSRKRYCQYRWGSSSPSANEDFKQSIKNNVLIKSLEKLQPDEEPDKPEKSFKNVNLKLSESKQLKKSVKFKSPDAEFYLKAKQTIKERIKYKVLNKKKLKIQGQDNVERNMNTLQPKRSDKILEVSRIMYEKSSKKHSRAQIGNDELKQGSNSFKKMKKTFFPRIGVQKTPKYSQQSINQFLYDTIDSLQQRQKSPKTLQQSNQQKIAQKYIKRLRQDSIKDQNKCGNQIRQQGFEPDDSGEESFIRVMCRRRTNTMGG